MFGRSSHSDNKAADAAKMQQPNPSVFPPAVPAAAAPAPLAAVAGSVIASDLTIAGQQVLLISQGRLQVDGEVRGDINGREVVIGQSGAVSGTVTAQSIDVRGKVSGALRGASITLQSTARVEGDITKMLLVIQEGAHFDGNVRRAKSDGEVTPNLDPGQAG